MNKQLQIDKQLQELLPPLSQEEYNLLEENIKANGCIDPIAIWTDTETNITYIIDGHNRYSICTKYNLDFKTIKMNFESKNDTIKWMIDTQLGRRNLSLIQRIIVVEKYREKLKEVAKKNQRSGIKTMEAIRTSRVLADMAYVGSGTMARYEYVMKNGDEDLKNKMLNDEIPITAAYDTLKKVTRCKNSNRKPIPQTTIKHLINKTNGHCEICNWGGLGLEGILLPHHVEKYCNTQNHNIDKIIMTCPNCHGIIHTLENCKDITLIKIIINSIDTKIKDEIIECTSILNPLISNLR